jgi:hypothetical protein
MNWAVFVRPKASTPPPVSEAKVWIVDAATKEGVIPTLEEHHPSDSCGSKTYVVLGVFPLESPGK